MLLGERDLEVLRFLLHNNLASRSQLQELFFGSTSYCNVRLRALFDHGYVLRHFPAVTRGGLYGEEAVYSIGPAAVPLLAQDQEAEIAAVQRHFRRRVAPLFVAHTLKIVDIFLLLRRAIAEAAITTDPSQADCTVQLYCWLGENQVRHDYEARGPGQAWQREGFKPDGFARLKCGAVTHPFFIECDLGHVSAGQWQKKIASHRRYLESGLFAETYGEGHFLMLVFTTGPGRVDNLLALAESEAAPFLRFTTFTQAEQEGVLASVWRAPFLAWPTALL